MCKFAGYFALSFVSLLLCGLVYFSYKAGQEAAYMSCISSVAAEIQKSNSYKHLIPNDNSWKILDTNEINFLMQKVQGRDCSQFDNPTLDLWNQRINVAFKKSLTYPQMIVWSNGADNISGTSDDLVVPYGSEIPK